MRELTLVASSGEAVLKGKNIKRRRGLLSRKPLFTSDSSASSTFQGAGAGAGRRSVPHNVHFTDQALRGKV